MYAFYAREENAFLDPGAGIWSSHGNNQDGKILVQRRNLALSIMDERIQLASTSSFSQAGNTTEATTTTILSALSEHSYTSCSHPFIVRQTLNLPLRSLPQNSLRPINRKLIINPMRHNFPPHHNNLPSSSQQPYRPTHHQRAGISTTAAPSITE